MRYPELITGWDIDGVGFNFGDSCHRFLDHIGLGHLWKSGPTKKPFWDWYKDWGWTTEEFLDFCHRGADAGFIFSGPVREGYVETMGRVAKMGHQIVVITDRSFGTTPEVSQRLTEEWFRQHGLEYDQLVFSADKCAVPTDTFIDDKLSNYDTLIDGGVSAVLLNRPWNEVEGGDARNRINHIEEYGDMIEEITSQGFADLTLV